MTTEQSRLYACLESLQEMKKTDNIVYLSQPRETDNISEIISIIIYYYEIVALISITVNIRHIRLIT